MSLFTSVRGLYTTRTDNFKKKLSQSFHPKKLNIIINHLDELSFNQQSQS